MSLSPRLFDSTPLDSRVSERRRRWRQRYDPRVTACVGLNTGGMDVGEGRGERPAAEDAGDGDEERDDDAAGVTITAGALARARRGAGSVEGGCSFFLRPSAADAVAASPRPPSWTRAGRATQFPMAAARRRVCCVAKLAWCVRVCFTLKVIPLWVSRRPKSSISNRRFHSIGRASSRPRSPSLNR